jgi:transporter family-2 protein
VTTVSTDASAPSTVGRRLAGVALAVTGGLALAAQARINGQLSSAIGVDLRNSALAGILTAVISFGSGLVLLVAGVVAAPFGRRGLRRVRVALREGGLRWWQCLGGASGAFLVSSQGLTVTDLGVAVFTVALVAGQVLSSLAVDRAGLGPQGPQPPTARRTVGALLAVPAVAIAVADQFGHAGLLLLAVLPLVAGALVAWQQAVNGRVSQAAGSSLVATLVNFTVGAVVLVLALAVPVAVHGLPAHWPGSWWLYTGGAVGIVVIGAAVAGVRLVGVLVVGLSSVAGQLIGALVLEAVVPAGPTGSLAFPVAGTVLALVAVVVAGLSGRRRSERMTAEPGAREEHDDSHDPGR